MHMRLFRSGARSTLASAIVVAMAMTMPAAVFGQGSDESAADSPTAKLRFLAGNRFGPTDMLIDGEPVFEDLVYADISDYVDVPAGEIALEAAGFQPAERTLALKPDTAYTAVLVPVADGVEIALVADSPKPKAGQARVRVVSLCPECTSVDYDAAGVKKPLAKRLDYAKGKLAGEYMKVKPGQLQLLARAKGADEPLAGFDPVTVDPGTSHSLFVVGQDAAGVTLVPAMDAAISSARFMNASREPKVVDIYLDGKKVVKRLFPGQAAQKPVDTLAGDHLVQVVETGTKPAKGSLVEGMAAFPRGAVAIEAVAGESLEAVNIPTSKAPKPKTSRIRFAHIDPEIPAVDIDLRGMDPILGLEVGEWTDYMTVPGNSSYVWIRPSDDPMGIYHEFPLDLAPGENLTGYLAGSPDIPTVEVVLVPDAYAKSKKK